MIFKLTRKILSCLVLLVLLAAGAIYLFLNWETILPKIQEWFSGF